MNEYKIVGWAHYDDEYPTKAVPNDKVYEMVGAVAAQIKESGYCFSGEEHQCGITGMPVFEDGTAFRATMRCWGSIMASVYSTEETKYNYMDFYMSSALEEKTPEYAEIPVKPFDEDTGAFPTATQEDMEFIKSSIAMQMQMMSTDKGVNQLYEFLSAWVASQLEEEDKEDDDSL